MTNDEKLAIIAGNLKDAKHLSDKSDAYLAGALFELASIALKCDTPEEALCLSRLVIPCDDRELFARFCRAYYTYRDDVPGVFPQPETAELPNTVIIPEIARLEEAVKVLQENGMSLNVAYGDSFAASADDALYGHSRYVLMPMSDPVEGRLGSFDRLREKYGLKIHAVVNIPAEDGRPYSYQLCAFGFPDISGFVPERLSFSADTDIDPLSYVSGAKVFGVRIVSLQITGSRIYAVFNLEGIDERMFAGLMMYLSDGADVTVDGCYNEL